LSNKHAKFREAGACVTRISNVGDSTARCSGVGLNPQSLLSVGDLVVGDSDATNGNVAGDGANRDTVTTRKCVTSEDDVGTLVDGQEVVLVLDSAVFNGQIGSRTIKPVSVRSSGVTATLAVGLISLRVINVDLRNCQRARVGNGKRLRWGVNDVDVFERP